MDLVKIRKKAKAKKEEESARSARPAAAARSRRTDEAEPRKPPSKPKPEPKPKPKPKPGPAPAAKRPPDREQPPVRAHGVAPEFAPAPGSPVPAAAAEPPRASAARDRLGEFKETAGTRREGTARTDGAVAALTSAPLLELLSFTLAGEQYAIEIERIAEIISPRPATAVPNAPASVVGIISLRGTIVTMLDLRRQLGHASEYLVGPETRTIVVEDGGGMAGFVVDRVLRVVKIDPSQIQSHPIVSPAEQTDAIRGVIQQGAVLTIVLDVERLLS